MLFNYEKWFYDKHHFKKAAKCSRFLSMGFYIASWQVNPSATPPEAVLMVIKTLFIKTLMAECLSGLLSYCSARGIKLSTHYYLLDLLHYCLVTSDLHQTWWNGYAIHSTNIYGEMSVRKTVCWSLHIKHGLCHRETCDTYEDRTGRVLGERNVKGTEGRETGIKIRLEWLETLLRKSGTCALSCLKHIIWLDENMGRVFRLK